MSPGPSSIPVRSHQLFMSVKLMGFGAVGPKDLALCNDKKADQI